MGPKDAKDVQDPETMPQSSKAISTTDVSLTEGNVKDPTSVNAENTSTSGASHVISPSDPLMAPPCDKEEVEFEDEEDSRRSRDNDESTILIEER